jgi:ATP-dependent helicase IRC3
MTVSETVELVLRDYQLEGLKAIDQDVADGVRRALVVWPTGAGKTVLFSHVIKSRGGRALVLVHRDELVQQTLAKLGMIAPELSLGVVKAERNEMDADVIVASVQTLSRPKRLEQLIVARTGCAANVDLNTIVVDEAHHAVADSYLAIIDALWGPYGPVEERPLLLGCTATPDRLDKVGLGYVFDKISHQVGLVELIKRGYLTDIEALSMHVDVNLDEVKYQAGDFSDGALARQLAAANAPQQLAQAFRKYAEDRTGLVFVPSVQLVYDTVHEFKEVGLEAVGIDGETPIEERRAILRDLSRGVYDAVINCMVLTEGFDEASVDCVVVGRPTASRALYQQMIGRGLRPYPGKDNCLVIDVVGNSDRHQLITAASLFGIDPKAAKKGVLQAIRDRDAEDERDQDELVGPRFGRLDVREVDLLGQRALVWVSLPTTGATGEQVVALDLGPQQGYVYVAPAAATATATDSDRGWDVLLHAGTEWGTRLHKLHAGVSFDWALGLAESYVSVHGNMAFAKRNLAWRNRPISDKQRETFQRVCRGQALPSTSGEANQALTMTFANRAWLRARR